VRKQLRAALIALVIGTSSLIPTIGAAGPAATHQVAEGQSLWKIAKRYNVSVRAIELANKLDGGPIQPGTVLKIPSAEEAKKLEAAADKKADKDKGDKKPDAKKSDKDDDAKADKKKADEKADKKKSAAVAPGLEKKPPAPPDAPLKWWLEPPNDASQTQKNPDERGGVNPCNTKDTGFGVYDGWKRSPSMGQMIIPARGGVTKDGRFDVVFHFHGHEPARKEFVKVMDGAVLVGIDLGIGSGAYSSGFASPQTWNQLLASVERGVADARGIPSAKARKIGLSAWSAGYGAVEMILRHTDGKNIDSVILLDGLHSGYAPGGPGTGLDEGQLAPFLAFARSAKSGKKLMYVSHSSIIPPGYASTTETANWLVMKLGGKPKGPKGKGAGPWGLQENARWDAGNFHMRGYDGNDKMDHCAHFGLMKDVLKVHIKPRWNSPKGQGPKKEPIAKDAPKKASSRT
jgi:murein DD-endopeptidase MepM/ murein hydrolase activator NlpD